MENKLTFKVKWKATLNDKEMSGVESEASWFLIDQTGNFWSHGPMSPVRPIQNDEYSLLVPLIKINDE